MRRPEELTVEAHHRDDGIRVVRVEGDVDLTGTEQVQGVCTACLEHDETTGIVVDLSGTGFLDSSGIGMLFRVHQVAGAAGVPLAVVATTPRVVRSLEISGAAARLALADSLEAACAAAADSTQQRT